jgi:TolB-like protein/DNA-binding winged helix-turn-helix (wHTH) protein
LFQGFRLDRGGLVRLDQDGVDQPVALSSRALDLLQLLVEHHGELVSKDQIMEAVWPQTVVEEGNLTVQISALRRILDRDRAQGSCIQTVSGRGYRFTAPVTQVEAAAKAATRRLAAILAGDLAGYSRLLNPKALLSCKPADCRRSGAIVGAAVAAALVIGCIAWWLWPAATSPSRAPNSADPATASSATPPPTAPASASNEQPAVAPRLSIVVLPFTNLNNDPEQQYFADAVTDDLTTAMWRISDSFVISRNTAFTYRNKPVDTKQIGRELGVRYVLEGSVRRAGSQVRISVQLIDAATGAHVWAERFESDAVDLFALQNEITTRIGSALGMELIGAEAARPTADPDALDYILRGRAAYAKGLTRDNYDAAVGLFERALALDPRSVGAQSQLANTLIGRALDEPTDSAAADIARAELLIDQALTTSPRNLLAHFAKGQALRAQHRCEEASREYEMVLAFNRNWVGALMGIGRCRILSGSLDEAIPPMEQAIRLNPRDPGITSWYNAIGVQRDWAGASAAIPHHRGNPLV